MIIDEKDILTIDNKEYVVVKKLYYNNLNHYYLTNINSITDFKFCFEQDGRFFEEYDKEKINDLMLLIVK